MKDIKITKPVSSIPDTDINKILIPLLQDTIADGNRHNKRMFIISIFLMISILTISIVSIIIAYRQTNKYQEFLNEFEFEGGYTYTQDIDAGDGGSATINDGININQ